MIKISLRLTVVFLLSYFLLSSCQSPTDKSTKVENNKPNAIDIDTVIAQFKRDGDYILAVQSHSPPRVQKALQNLFGKFKLLAFFENLSDLEKHQVADYHKALIALDAVSKQATFEPMNLGKHVVELRQYVDQYKIQTSVVRGLLLKLDDLTQLLQTLIIPTA